MKQEWRRFAPYGLILAGIAALVSFGIYVVFREFNIYLQISLALTVLGLAGFILLDPERVRVALTGRQARYGSNALVLTLAVIGILVAINYLIIENPWRVDLTEDQANTLAPETLAVFEALPEPVHALAFFSPQMNSQVAQDLLDDYAYASDEKITYEFIDPQADPVAAERAEAVRDGTIVFTMEGKREVVMSVTEQEFTGALVRLMSGEERVLYFLTGHGEYGLDEAGDQGLSQAKRLLESKNYRVQALSLLSADGVPEDADVVVIARPLHPLDSSEIELLAEYVSAGGALVVLHDSPIFTEFGDQPDDLAGYLEGYWGILLGQDLVVDQTSFLGSTSPVGVAGSGHLITRKLQGVATAFPTARSVTLTEHENVSPVILISTANEGSWAETDLEAVSAGEDIAFDEGADILGPVPIAAVVEDFATNSRVAVFGDGDFAMNANFDFFGNGDLFVNSVDWAAGQDELVDLTPKSPTQRLLLPPQPYLMNLISLSVVCILPGIVLATGIGVWIRKRRRG